MLSENIKKLRLAQNISQVELGKSLGVPKQCISNWENDNILPSIEMLIKIAKYFNVSTDYLLGLCNTSSINVEGLADKELAHINLIINDLKNYK